MAEDNKESLDDSMEEEMSRLMEEDAAAEGGDAPAEDGAAEVDAGEAAEGEAGLEAEMLQAMMDEAGDGGDEGGAPEADPMSLMPDVGGEAGDGNQMLDVKLPVSIELGETQAQINAVLEWTEGSLIELSKVSGEAVDVKVNGKPYAKGEVVTIAENFGVRITELVPINNK